MVICTRYELGPKVMNIQEGYNNKNSYRSLDMISVIPCNENNKRDHMLILWKVMTVHKKSISGKIY
jgi:hypothetical protein